MYRATKRLTAITRPVSFNVSRREGHLTEANSTLTSRMNSTIDAYFITARELWVPRKYAGFRFAQLALVGIIKCRPCRRRNKNDLGGFSSTRSFIGKQRSTYAKATARQLTRPDNSGKDPKSVFAPRWGFLDSTVRRRQGRWVKSLRYEII